MAENTNPTSEAQPQPTAAAVQIPEQPSKPITEAPSEDKMADNNNKINVKSIAGFLSIITFILSLPILALVIWLLYMEDCDCEYLLKLPRFQIGIAVGMIFVFLISNAAVMLRSKAPVPAFFTAMVFLIVMLTMGLALMGAYKLESRKLLASPRWFREKVRSNTNWENIKSCIFHKQVCDDLAARSLTLQSYDLIMKTLSPLEAGCCKPPEICDMKYVNATFWTKGEGKVTEAMDDPDCERWRNDPDNLCYDCESCKDGFVKMMESKWGKLGLFLTLMASFLITSHIFLFVLVMWERYSG